MQTTVFDNLTIDIGEMKNKLRISDEILTKVAVIASIGDNVLTVENTTYFEPTSLVRFGINTELYKVINVDYLNNQITLDKPLTSPAGIKTPVWTHTDNQWLLDLVAGAKRECDLFLNRPEDYFKNDQNNVVIGEDIKIWCMNLAARNYENGINGLAGDSDTGNGSYRWRDEQWYKSIHRHRNMEGLI